MVSELVQNMQRFQHAVVASNLRTSRSAQRASFCRGGLESVSAHTQKLVMAMQESEVQAEYDSVLREAKLLRLDLQHALKNCLEHKVSSCGLAVLGCLCDCIIASMLMLRTHKYDLMQGYAPLAANCMLFAISLVVYILLHSCRKL